MDSCRKITGKTIVYILIFMLLGIVQICISMNPANTFQYSGLAVDSHGRLYLGESLWIGVYENDVRIREIANNRASLYYEFTIVDDQVHLWHAPRRHEIYNLDGELIHWEAGEYYPLSEKERFEFTTEDGCHYVMKNWLRGRMKVVCYDPNGTETVVFRMPLIPYLVQYTMPLYFCIIVLWVGRSKWSAKWSIHALKKYWRPEMEEK